MLSYLYSTECLGTVWQAEPVSEDPRTAIRLELLVVSFDSRYYSTTQGSDGFSSLLSKADSMHHRSQKAQVT